MRPPGDRVIRPDAAALLAIDRGVRPALLGPADFECCPNITSDPNSPRRGTTGAPRIYVSRGPLDYLWTVGADDHYCIRWRVHPKPVAKS